MEPKEIFKKKKSMYRCSITNKKKKIIKDEKVVTEAELYKNEISSTKPRKPGKLIWLTSDRSKNVEKIGSLEYKPEIKKNSRVLNRIKIVSQIKKSIDAVIRWFKIPSCIALSFSIFFEKTKKSMKFIWTVVEKATTTLESICISILSVPSITPSTEQKKNKLKNVLKWNNSRTRNIPKIDNFTNTPLKKIDKFVGPSACALEIQKWKGHIGTFTEKPKIKKNNE